MFNKSLCTTGMEMRLITNSFGLLCLLIFVLLVLFKIVISGSSMVNPNNYSIYVFFCPLILIC